MVLLDSDSSATQVQGALVNLALHKKTEESQGVPANFACIRAPKPTSYPMPTKEVLSKLMLECVNHHVPVKG